MPTSVSLVHADDEGFLASRHAFGEHDGDIVCRFDDEHFQRDVDGDLSAHGKPKLARRLVDGILGAGELVSGWTSPRFSAWKVT